MQRSRTLHTFRFAFWVHMRRSYFAATPILVCCLFPHAGTLLFFSFLLSMVYSRINSKAKKRSHSISIPQKSHSATGGRSWRSDVPLSGKISCAWARYVTLYGIVKRKRVIRKMFDRDDRSARYRIVFDASRKRPVCSSHVAGAPRDGVAFSS